MRLDKRFGVKKSNQNLCNKDSLVRETLLIKTFRNQLNSRKTSIDLNTIKIQNKERTFEELVIKSLKHLAKQPTIKIDREMLNEDYEKNLKSGLERMIMRKCGCLTEQMISNTVYLVDQGVETESKLNAKSKLIIFVCVLIYLNDDQTLNDDSINQLFVEFGENKVVGSSVFGCLSRFSGSLVFSNNTIEAIVEMMNDLKKLMNVDENEFEKLVTNVLNAARELIKAKENRRKIMSFYSTAQYYVMERIIEYSHRKEQFLNHRSNVEIYLQIPNIEQNFKHKHSSLKAMFFKTKAQWLKGIKPHCFDSVEREEKKRIKELIIKNYNELVKHPENHLIYFDEYSIEQRYAAGVYRELNLQTVIKRLRKRSRKSFEKVGQNCLVK